MERALQETEHAPRAGRPRKAARLKSRIRDGEVVWFVVDGSRETRIGVGERGRIEAEKALGSYISAKHAADRTNVKDPDNVKVEAVLIRYLDEHGDKVKSRATLAYATTPLLNFWETKTCGEINRTSCQDYVAWRCAQRQGNYKDQSKAPPVSPSTARRELGVLQAALNFCHTDGMLERSVPVTLPPASQGRTRFLTRDEAAALLWGALGFYRDKDGKVRRARPAPTFGKLIETPEDTEIARHIGRFILIGLYTGTRHEAILRLRWAVSKTDGYVDLKRGILYRAGTDEQQTNKRRNPVKIPARLMFHLRRWQKLGSRSGHIIEWRGKPIKQERAAFNTARRRAGLDDSVTPHVLKHTCATWLLWAGVPLWEVASYLSTTEKVIQDTYGQHSPHFQTNAAGAFSRISGTFRDTP